MMQIRLKETDRPKGKINLHKNDDYVVKVFPGDLVKIAKDDYRMLYKLFGVTYLIRIHIHQLAHVYSVYLEDETLSYRKILGKDNFEKLIPETW